MMACIALVTTGEKDSKRGFYRQKSLNSALQSVFFIQNFKIQNSKPQKTPFFANFLGEEEREEGVGVIIIVIGGVGE